MNDTASDTVAPLYAPADGQRPENRIDRYLKDKWSGGHYPGC